MSEDSFRRISTPETWVGAGGRWSNHGSQEISEKRSTLSVDDEPSRKIKADPEPDPAATEEEPSSYTEQDHYSESDFHAEEEGDEEDEQNEQEPDPQIAVTQCRPEDFDTGNHLLHIDFITDELQTFRLSSHDGPHLRRAGTGGGGRKSFNQQQQQQQHNISFSRERVRQIERTNQILLRRILSTKPTLQTLSIRPQTVAKRNSSTGLSRVTSAALNRQKLQKRIASENEILLKKVTSIGLPKRTTSGM
ncbi:uncharacterized protein LOC126571460 [Anopheles aquasalis]|uniref:uncharacterized protein LOC126571460 n=1 Tax=Anopheles aquasalis TaxID=42839 RepID=UPI00215B3480|nr:uncharacterized protein LOC126571460 [Anopheles aquasalis]